MPQGDIFISAEHLSQFTSNTWYDCEYGVGGKELIHEACDADVLNWDKDNESPSLQDYMKAAYDHLRICK